MTDYKRFVSYMYVYTNGIKRKNVGYARVETRNGECKFTIYIHMDGLAEGIFPTYLIHRPAGEMDLIYIGDSIVKNQIMDSRLTVNENNVMDSGHKFSEMGGILLFLNSGVFYATQWDDKPVILDEVLEALKPKSKKHPAGTGPRQAENIFLRDKDKPDYKKNTEITSPGKKYTDIPSFTGNIFADKQTGMEGKITADKTADTEERSFPYKQARAVKEIIDDQSTSYEKSTYAGGQAETEGKTYTDKQADAENRIYEDKQAGSEERALTDKPAGEEERTFADKAKSADAQKDIYAGRQAKAEESIFADRQAEREKSNFAGYRAEAEQIVSSDNKADTKSKKTAIYQADAEMPKPADGAGKKSADEKADTEEKISADAKPDGKPDSMPNETTNQNAEQIANQIAKQSDLGWAGSKTAYSEESYMKKNIEDTKEKTSAGQQLEAERINENQKPVRREEDSYSQVPIYMLPRGYKTKEGVRPGHFDKPINPWDQVNRYRRFEAEKIKASDQSPKESGRPAANEVQKENQTIENIFNSYPRIYPFEDNEIKRCVKIEPKDIGTLPSGAWNLSNNSFLLHGYYCYHHMIFAEIKDRYGCRYIIGVPGIYHNRERFMARMFGFENFKSIRNRDLKQGDFGYWYREINLQ